LKDVPNINTIVGLTIITILLLVIPLLGYARGDSLNPGIFSIDSRPYGLSYSEWSTKWWQWIISIPAKDSPRLDLTGQKCSVAQDDPNVWFLAQIGSGSVERNCTIPKDKAIFIPILTGECDYLSNPTVKTESDLRKCAYSGIEGAQLSAVVDGRNLKNLERYRVQSPLFDFVIPSDTGFGQGPVGTTKAVADGYHVILEPPSPGRHTLQFSANIVDNPTIGTYSFAIDVKYT
jgi:hypothetical protein